MNIVKIEQFGSQGDGIANLDGQNIYVPYTIEGEKVSAIINNNRGQLIEIIEKSPSRVTPICEYYTQCGGCTLQHMNEEKAAEFKTKLIEEAISITPSEFTNAYESGRRRVKFNIEKQKNDIILGFMAAKSHDIIDIENCPIVCQELQNFIPRLRELCRTLLKPDEKVTANLTACDNGIDIDIAGIKPLNKKSRGELESLAIAAQKSGLTRLTLNGELAFQTITPVVKFANIPVEVPPNCFLQATKTCEDAITSQLLAWAKGSKRIIDLFSGVGTFSLPLKQIGEVRAYELNTPSVVALNKAAKAAAGGHKLEAFTRDLFRLPVSPLELKNVDLAVLDPARAGANYQVKQLVKSKINKIIYISCEPASFAEDLKVLVEGGFKLKELKAFDQFRYSTHVEIMGLFVR